MTWSEILAPVLSSAKLMELKKYIKEGRTIKTLLPEGKEVFRAFDLCPYEKVRVVILGQDPYPQAGVPDGLAFSSKIPEWPKSLEVIFKEIYNDLNIQWFHNIPIKEFFPTSDLTGWTKMGFLLLNTVLTVEEGKPGSHKDMGWELVTEEALTALSKRNDQIIYMLWGKEAQKYESFITNPKHLVLKAPHPAAELHNPGGETFTGCRHFSIVRDVIPTIYSKGVFASVNLDAAFDKEKAKQIAKEHYPMEPSLLRYIDEDLCINVPVNREMYFRELRNIESMFSTKIIDK